MKLSIEIPVAIRHRRDMTEKLLKATLNLNKQTNKQYFLYINSIFCFLIVMYITCIVKEGERG